MTIDLTSPDVTAAMADARKRRGVIRRFFREVWRLLWLPFTPDPDPVYAGRDDGADE